jgi:hypothetical protein
MIYKIESEESTLTNSLIKLFQQLSSHPTQPQPQSSFIFSNGIIYLHTTQPKSDLISTITNQFPESTGNFYIQTIDENKVDKLVGHPKTWAKGILIKEKMQKEVLDNMNLYESYLNHLEEGLKQGNFIKPEQQQEQPEEKEVNTTWKDSKKEKEEDPLQK